MVQLRKTSFFFITTFIAFGLQFFGNLTLFSQNYSSFDNEKSYQFLNACYSDDTSTIFKLINDSIDLNIQSDDGATAAHYAVINNNQQLLSLLKIRGASLDVPDQSGRTPMLVAIASNKPLLVDFLLKMSISPMVRDRNGWDGAFYAVRTGDTSMVHFIFQYVSDINRVDNDGKSLLHHAVQLNNIEVIRILLNKNIDVSLKDYEGNSAVLYAYQLDCIDAFDFMVQQGANPFENNRNSENILDWAIQKKDTFTLNQLIIPHLDQLQINHKAALIKALSGDNKPMIRIFEDAGVLRPWHPVYDHSYLFFPFVFNANEFLSGLAYRYRDCNRNLDLGGGFLFRPFASSVYKEVEPHIFYQYHEYRYFIFLEQNYGFYLLRNPNYTMKISLGIQEGYTWGSWRGTNENPLNAFMLGYYSGLTFTHKALFSEFRWNNLNFKSLPISNTKWSISIGFLIN